jgi:hypothetical protein
MLRRLQEHIALSDGDDGRHPRPDTPDDPDFVHGIKRGRRLVENQYRRTPRQRPAKRNSLSLAS